MRITTPITAAILLPILLTLVACGGGDDAPRTLDEIFLEEQTLPVLYLTAITGKRVTAPARHQRFADPETGEVCWPALVCRNPNCPHLKQTGEPFIFISPDIGFVANPDGSASPGNPDPRTTKGTGNLCPQCLKARNRNTENAATRQQYVDWVKMYVLPETEKRMQELAEERRKRHEWDQTKAQ